MVEKFVEHFAKMLVLSPTEVRVQRNDVDENFTEIVVYANKEDAGKIIGKDGNMVNALKTIISGCKAKDGRSYRVLVRSTSEQE